MAELWKKSAHECQELFRTTQAKPTDVLASNLERLDAVNDRINAFAHIDREGAEIAARASDDRWAGGRPLSALDGSVVTIKDNINVEGMPCVWGSELYLGNISDSDETPVQLLREAGCVILGKTTVPEFTTAQTNVSTKAFGTTRNPWNLALTTGTSSGGACASLAAGIGQIALATDGGGSIRRPASHNGLTGLKPSTGRVARRNSLPFILHDCEIIGPIARCVEDLSAAYEIISKPHPEDRSSFGFAEGVADAKSFPKRIFYLAKVPGNEVDREIELGCAAAVENMKSLGFEVETGPPPFDFALYESHWPTIRDAGLAWLVRGRDWRGKISSLHAKLVERGEQIPAMDYVAALAAFREIQASFGQFFQRYDLFMSPAAGTLPWGAESNGPPQSKAFSGIVNASGYPAIAIPVAQDAGSLPLGFQVVGAWGQERHLLEVAGRYEAAFPWWLRWPDV